MSARPVTRAVEIVLPGPLATRTGGYAYDRRMVEGLRALGWRVATHELPPRFPFPDAAARTAAARVFESFVDGALVLADGLAWGALPELAARHGGRLRIVALVHHPLHAETGLADAERSRLFASERDALRGVRAVVVTGRHTAAAMRAEGLVEVAPDVVEPGTDEMPLRPARDAPACRMLCVATVTRRKRHALLVEALSGLAELPWTLDCVGGLDFDADCAREVAALVAAHGLEARIRFPGPLDEEALRALRLNSDLGVQPAAYEGYGMALAEAIAQGLPAVASRTGAAAELIGDAAGVLVDPALGITAWRDALVPLLSDPMRREACAAAARRRAAGLARWPAAARALGAVLARVGDAS